MSTERRRVERELNEAEERGQPVDEEKAKARRLARKEAAGQDVSGGQQGRSNDPIGG